jgi:hypothetical protein
MATFAQNVEFEIQIFGVLQARSQICGDDDDDDRELRQCVCPHGIARLRCTYFCGIVLEFLN